MHETNNRLRFVPRGEATRLDADGVTWWSAIDEAVGATAFEYGRASVDRGRTVRFTPNRFDDVDAEVMALITDGRGTVSMRGDEVDLSPQDCVFLPVGVDGAVTSTCDALRFIWGRARNQKSPLYGEARQQTMAPTAGIVNPYLDVEPGVSYEEGNASRHWEAVCPETVGSCHCNLGLFQRPPGSGMQVRGHDPPTVSEAFTVLDGRLQITGPEGTEYVLEPGDFLFVPEYGKHANKNVGSSAVTYACLETPARSRTVSPAAPE